MVAASVVFWTLLLVGAVFGDPNPLDKWVRSKRDNVWQFCTIDALEQLETTLREDLDILTQSVFEIGFNLQEFINLGMVEKYPAQSCSHLCYAKPGMPSGYYYISPGKGKSPYRMFCNMEMQGSPFGSTQGWMKVADFDMRRPQDACPKGFRFVHWQGQRVCAKTVRGGCQSVTFPLYGFPYGRLCGRGGAFQVGTNNAFHRFNCEHCSINDPYVDGISITHGSPRRHIWSLATSWTGYLKKGYTAVCPCAAGKGTPPPAFVGDNYFCEVGQYWSSRKKIDAADPLWDGEGCGRDEERCCEAPGLPWFCTDIPGGSHYDIEVRVCADQATTDEDLLWQSLEMYIQ